MKCHKKIKAAKKAWETMRKQMISTCDITELRQLAKDIFDAEQVWENDFTTDGIIAKNIGKTTLKSFLRFSDKNKITNSLILRYISNTGTPIDVQAMYISESLNIDCSENDIVEFMISNDRGVASHWSFAKYIELKNIWKQITGFKFCPKFANKFILE